jgi:signal transduction histidine kinase
MVGRQIRIDQNAAEALLELYSVATGCPVGLYEAQKLIVPKESAGKFQGYCRKLHSLGLRERCDADHLLRGSRATTEGFEICHAGLFNYTLPIVVKGQVVAALLCGQTRLSDTRSESLSKQRRLQVYGDLRLGAEQRGELERLYSEISQVDPHADEVPMVDHLWAIQTQFYSLLMLDLENQEARKLFEASQENIAHEFQIRLQALWADSENLARAMRVGQPISTRMMQDSLEILRGAQKLNVLVQNLTLGLGEYEWEEYSIRSIIEESVRLYETEAKKKFVKFNLEIEDARFEMSLRHIVHMMNNLVHNAVKYSFSGSQGRDREVRIRGTRESRIYRFEIENYGIGILPDERDRIFEKGVRGKLTEDESRTGAGLGLYIAKEIVKNHGGSIEARSRSQGSAYLTVFTVTLPLSRSKRR